MAINPDKFRVTDADEITTERWNLAFVEIALALAEVQEKAATFDAATDQLIATALFRVSETLAPSLEARDLARDWAEKASDTDVVGVGTRSAKHHALAAAVSAGLAAAAQAVTEAARDAAEEAAEAAATFDPDIYAAKNSPALTGTPTAPTAATSTNTTQIATTAFVKAVVAALVDSSPAALDTLNELAAALGDDPNFATTITNALAAKASLTGSETLTNKTMTAPVINGASGSTAEWNIGAGQFYKGTDGKIGIGTASPGWDLVLQKSVNATIILQVANPNAGSSAAAGFQVAAGAGLTSFTQLTVTDYAGFYHLVSSGDIVTGYHDVDTHVFRNNAGTEKFRSSAVSNAANVRAAAAGAVVTADLIETASAIVTLTDASTVAVDWDAFVSADLVLQGNHTLGNPTNAQPGTCRFILVKGNDGTDRTLSWGSNYKGDLPSLTDIDNAKWYLITLWAYTTSHIVVAAARAL